MATKYLTPEQFVKLPLSEAIPYVIADMKKMVRAGIELDMGSYVEVTRQLDGTKGHICSVCAGGAACMGFYPMRLIKSASPDRLYDMLEGWEGGSKARHTAMVCIQSTFNYIRLTDYGSAYYCWNDNYLPEEFRELLNDLSMKHRSFYHVVSGGDEKGLYQQMKELSKLLRKYGK